MKRFLALLLPLALAACGTPPEPFYGNPGPEAERLAIPPAPVLMVPTPMEALLGDDAARGYAQDLADALVRYDVPSLAGPVVRDEWRLGISARLAGGNVIPAYVITGPDGKIYGREDGAPEPAQAWSAGDETALQGAATVDAKTLSKLLARINAQVQGSNPESLENRPPRIFIGGVTGAPGDGDAALPLDLKRDLPGPDLVVVNSLRDADFSVTGRVKTEAQGGQILVELDWRVRDSNHRKIGQVTQLHLLNAQDITPYWGDVAQAAATQAAAGIDQVVGNAVLKKAK